MKISVMNVAVSLIILFLIIGFTIMISVMNIVLNNKTQLDNLQDVCQNHQGFKEIVVTNKKQILVSCSDNTKFSL